MLKRLLSFFIFLSLMLSLTPLAHANTNEEACPSEASTQSPSTQVALTALYPNPNTGEEEWIEITNHSASTIDLSHYTLEDATAKAWSPTGNLEAGEALQITGFPFQLNNSNETVTLKTNTGTIVDTWTYSTSVKGEILTRETSTTNENTTTNEPSTTTETTPSSTPTQWPIFSEALPNPEGSDSTDEWIELYNPYEETLVLTGLQLDDISGGSNPHTLTGTLAPESYLLLSVTETNLTLNNDADQIRLLGIQEELLWEIAYSNPKEGTAYALFSGTYIWTSTPTPGEENRSGSTETEAEEVTNDSSEEPTYENGDLSEEVELTEIFPNPEGTDTEEEWIELTNGGESAVNLGNWSLTDASGKTYTFPDNTVIEPGSTLVLYRTVSEISLNNSNESVSLADYTGETLSTVHYESSEEDQSYAQIHVEEASSTQAGLIALGNPIKTVWDWVTPTPGKENPIWKQIKGTVTEYDGTLLTLFDGISTWTFTTTNDASAALLYSTGNVLLVQASLSEGIYQVMQAELVEKGQEQAKTQIPWFLILSTLGLCGWIGFEAYKKYKKTLNFSQMALH